MPGVPIDRAALLKEEYFHLQDMIEAFDARALQIKGWSVTVSLAGMAAALITKDIGPSLKALAFAIAAIASLAFWMIEYSWKRFQWAFYPRVREIEAAFAAGEPVLAPLQISSSFRASFDQTSLADLVKLFYPFIMFPHIAIAAIGVYLAAQFWNVPAGAEVKLLGAGVAVSAPSGTAR